MLLLVVAARANASPPRGVLLLPLRGGGARCARGRGCARRAVPPRAPRPGEVQARLPRRRGQEEGDGGELQQPTAELPRAH